MVLLIVKIENQMYQQQHVSGWRHHWTILFLKLGWSSNDCKSRSILRHNTVFVRMILMSPMCSSNKMETHVTKPNSITRCEIFHLFYCSELAASIVWSNSFRLFFVGLFEINKPTYIWLVKQWLSGDIVTCYRSKSVESYWLPRLYDLKPLNYFLWVYLK